MHLYESGIDGPVVCTQCVERYCTECPVNAITVGSHGEIVVAPTICDLCGSCEQQCPIGAIEQHDELVYVCDLCGGKPRCVDMCTEHAIVYEVLAEDRESLAEFKESSQKMNTSEKRRNYIERLGTEVRKTWRARHD
ncbi:MAG: 4Fe-4S binding protein [Thermoplasmata archaeon]